MKNFTGFQTFLELTNSCLSSDRFEVFECDSALEYKLTTREDNVDNGLDISYIYQHVVSLVVKTE